MSPVVFMPMVVADDGGATAAAARARDTECRIVMREFVNKGSTLDDQRAYSKCVYRFWPDDAPIPVEQAIAIKVAILILLLSLVLGVRWGWSQGGDKEDRALSTVLGLLLFSSVTVMTMGMFVGIGYGLRFLVS